MNNMGLRRRTDASNRKSPIIAFSEILAAAMKEVHIPLTEEGIPAVSPQFDHYRSTIVAPDHLLAGLATNVIDLCFKHLPNKYRRKQIDHMICHALKYKNLVEQAHVLPISGTFSVLFCAIPVFKEVSNSIPTTDEMNSNDHDIFIDSFKLMRKSSLLTSTTYWYQTEGIDDYMDVVLFSRNEGASYIFELQNMCSSYIKICDEICRSNL